MNKEPESLKLRISRVVLSFIVFAFILWSLFGTIFEPPGSGSGAATQKAAMQTAKAIGNILSKYALDHDGHYPEGKTSTEVFQHLIDEKYVLDPTIFYLPMDGKVRPQSDRLKPENVAWDVTCCVDSSSSDGLPLIFLTGYKITYQPGASAVLLLPPYSETWYEWVYSVPFYKRPFIAVCYKNGSANWTLADKDGSIPNFIPADFDPKGKVYRQLTP